MSTATDYIQPRRYDWPMLGTRLCGGFALSACAIDYVDIICRCWPW